MYIKKEAASRKETLKKLLHVITVNEDAIIKALYDDFRKAAFESVLTETNFVTSELKQTIRNIQSWSRPKMVVPSLLNFPSTDYIFSEPFGQVLIISPWNYPFQLAMCPLIAAFAAGNSVVLKPSELAPNTAAIISQIVSEVFDPIEVEVFQGGPEVSGRLLLRRWDYIFFTGSVAVGKKVAAAAAVNLTPVTLELGGKNPCIVDATANLKLAAKRIVWGKFINAGQTCIAPDYLLVEETVKLKFLSLLKQEIILAYGENPQLSPDLPRIINEQHHDRLTALLESQKVYHGGKYDKAELYISPTLIDEGDLGSALMRDEIFGPILPVIGYTSEAGLEQIITAHEKPLSLYVFTDDRSFAKRIIERLPFGGGCINDTLVHFANGRLPFGGVGNSGIGAYHGSRSFDVFSHKKAVVKKATWLDIPLRYAPYKDKIKLVRKWLKWL